jgi:hypothetical protein
MDKRLAASLRIRFELNAAVVVVDFAAAVVDDRHRVIVAVDHHDTIAVVHRAIEVLLDGMLGVYILKYECQSDWIVSFLARAVDRRVVVAAVRRSCNSANESRASIS